MKSLNMRLDQHVKKPFHNKQQHHVLFKEIPKILNVTPLRRGRPPKRKSKDLEMNITRTDILTYNVEQLIQQFEKEFQIIHVNKKRILPNIDKSQQKQFRNATCNNEHANFNNNVNNNNHCMQNRSPPPNSFTFVNEYSNYGNESKLQNKIIETTHCNTNQMLNESNNVNNPSPIATSTINSNEIKQNKICITSISIRIIKLKL